MCFEILLQLGSSHRVLQYKKALSCITEETMALGQLKFIKHKPPLYEHGR